MQIIRKLHLLSVLAILLGAGVFFTPAANAVTIHTLLIIDGAASNFEQHEASKKAMGRLLKQIRRDLQCNVQISHFNTDVNPNDSVPSKYASSDNILDWISQLRPNSDDIVWVYYSGHGGVHSGTDNFYLSLLGGKFDRNRFARRIEALPCRLKILMTDACSYSGDPVVGNSPPDLNPFRNLFLEHKGFFNVVGAAKGELAGGSPLGGWFTRGFMRVMLGINYLKVDLNGDGFISWKEVLVKTREETNKAFQAEKDRLEQYWKDELERINQTGQNPVHLGELPKRIDR